MFSPTHCPALKCENIVPSQFNNSTLETNWGTPTWKLQLEIPLHLQNIFWIFWWNQWPHCFIELKTNCYYWVFGVTMLLVEPLQWNLQYLTIFISPVQPCHVQRHCLSARWARWYITRPKPEHQVKGKSSTYAPPLRTRISSATHTLYFLCYLHPKKYPPKGNECIYFQSERK